MRILGLWTLILCVSFVVAAPVLAQDADKKNNSVPPGTTEYEFEDELLRGDIRGPSGARVTLPLRVPPRNLIKIRRQFMPEMIKTVETL